MHECKNIAELIYCSRKNMTARFSYLRNSYPRNYIKLKVH